MDLPDSQKKKPKKKAPSPRRDGREAALQYLYGHDIQGEVDFSEQSLSDFWELRLAKQPAQEFASKILVGIREKLPLLDAAIRETLENFAFQRLTPVDRNILRIGAYELLYDEEIPRQVAINEAVEIAKRFGGEESPGFINGILDNLRVNPDKD